ncbi:putative BTB/POZ domain-containing protein [Cotonvirus japonicus]|uniref:BTB/POZ domain-containing protein n=1 Tax=Cotonvirus japonicus TaxID=2811091 RepID=A0ABM7NQT6_9VIRU|nr:putative BTB/POZ domain-containing protein [Cotonvirus japonicus]BCS82510.1 putative BTB/POZ domain-containing protein [Cotonvirus japonicus]
MNDIITVITNDQVYQTSRLTLSANDYLTNKIVDNTIKLNMSSKSVKIILNYLRGNNFPYDIIDIDIENDLSVCGILIDKHEKIKINVGGKIFSVDKNLISSKLNYFKNFLHYNSEHDPDYTKILIDRCFDLFQQVLEYIENPNGYYLSQELENELGFYAYDICSTIKEFINVDNFTYVNVAYNKYNNNKKALCLMKKIEVKEFFSSIKIIDGKKYIDRYTIHQFVKLTIIRFKKSINFKLLKKSYFMMGEEKILLKYLLSKKVAIIDYNNYTMTILYDPALYENDNRAYGLRLYLPCVTQVKSITNFLHKNLETFYDKYGFIDSSVCQLYTVKNSENTSVIEINIDDIIDGKHENFYGNKYYDFIFNTFTIQNRPELKISHIEIIKNNIVVCRSKVTLIGENYYINKLFNNEIGVEYLISNNDAFFVKIYLDQPISKKIYINCAYDCTKECNMSDKEFEEICRIFRY